MTELQTYRVMIQCAGDDLNETIAKVSDDLFAQRPLPEANPINFIYFHVLRHWDRDINVRIRGQDPATDTWHQGGFTELTGYDPTGKGELGIGTGYGYNQAEVDEVTGNKAALVRYQRALKDETDALLASLDDMRLGVERTTPSGRRLTIAGHLRHLIAHTYLHVGDIEYVKGLVGAPACDVPNVA